MSVLGTRDFMVSKTHNLIGKTCINCIIKQAHA